MSHHIFNLNTTQIYNVDIRSLAVALFDWWLYLNPTDFVFWVVSHK
jgi:hypothetical protein